MDIREELEKYNDYKSDIRRIDRDIANLKLEEVTISGSNFEVNGDIKPKGFMSSNVEKKVINNADKIKELEAQKNKIQAHIDYLDSLINTLDDYHRRIIELKYKYNKTSLQVATILYRTKRNINKELKNSLEILQVKYEKRPEKFPDSSQ